MPGGRKASEESLGSTSGQGRVMPDQMIEHLKKEIDIITDQKDGPGISVNAPVLSF